MAMYQVHIWPCIRSIYGYVPSPYGIEVVVELSLGPTLVEQVLSELSKHWQFDYIVGIRWSTFTKYIGNTL